MTKFWVDPGGKLIKATSDDGEPPPGGRLVTVAPASGRDTWDGAKWVPALPPPDPDAELAAAIGAAATLDELKAALLGTAGRQGRVRGRPS